LDLLLRTVREIANQVYGGVGALYYVQAGLNGRNAPSGLHSTGLGDLRYLRQAVANWGNVNAVALSRKSQIFDFLKILPREFQQNHLRLSR
jgi:hypothetical protein